MKGISRSLPSRAMLAAALASAGVAVVAAGAVSAKPHHKPRPHVTVTKLTFYTDYAGNPGQTNGTFNGRPGATHKYCSDTSTPSGISWDAKIKHPPMSFREIFTVNGKVKKAKTFKFFLVTSNSFGDSISGRAFPPGRWKITFKKGNKKIGSASMKIVDTC